MPVDRPELDKLLAAAKQHKMTDAELAEQRASWVRGEMGMGEASVMQKPAISTDVEELIRLHKAATEGKYTFERSLVAHVIGGDKQDGVAAAFIRAIKTACDDGLLERLRTAEDVVAKFREEQFDLLAQLRCAESARAEIAGQAEAAETSLAALKAENERLRKDAAILLASIDFMSGATGEGPDDAAMIEQIRSDLETTNG